MTVSGGEMTALNARTFPGEERAVADARRFTREAFPAGPATDDIELVVSELMTNSVEHSDSGKGGQVVITFSIGRGRIRVEVSDDGSAQNSPRLTDDTDATNATDATKEAEAGRGLMIVRAVSVDWGVIHTDWSTTVWCEIAIPNLNDKVDISPSRL
jgi:anti-sigma regulatory factor (Ser/Thr protein kinase)